MAYQETTKTSYGKRLGNSLSGILVGFILIIAGTVVLWKNEGRVVHIAKMLKNGAAECVDVADVSSVDASLNGKLIHAIAVAQTTDEIQDPDFPISVNAIQLKKDVEYYQWVEHTQTETKDKVGGAQETVTTYTYSKEWVSRPVNSGEFKDPQYQGINNKVRIEVTDSEVYADNVTFGGYKLPTTLIHAIPCDVPVQLDSALATAARSVDKNVLYYGNPAEPAVGDVRITFTKAVGGEASVLAKVINNTFEPYTSNGKSLITLSMGNHSKDNMFESEEKANKTTLWLLRILGIILVIAGFRGIFNIVTTLLKVLPPLAKIADLGVGLVAGVLGLVWSLIVIIIGWIAYRPALGITLLVLAVVLVAFLVMKSKKAAAAAPAAPVE